MALLETHRRSGVPDPRARPFAAAVFRGRHYEALVARALAALAAAGRIGDLAAQPRIAGLGLVPDFAFTAGARRWWVLVTSSTVVRASDAKFWETQGECRRLRELFPADGVLAVLCGPRSGWKAYMPAAFDPALAALADLLDVTADEFVAVAAARIGDAVRGQTSGFRLRASDREGREARPPLPTLKPEA